MDFATGWNLIFQVHTATDGQNVGHDLSSIANFTDFSDHLSTILPVFVYQCWYYWNQWEGIMQSWWPWVHQCIYPFCLSAEKTEEAMHFGIWVPEGTQSIQKQDHWLGPACPFCFDVWLSNITGMKKCPPCHK